MKPPLNGGSRATSEGLGPYGMRKTRAAICNRTKGQRESCSGGLHEADVGRTSCVLPRRYFDKLLDIRDLLRLSARTVARIRGRVIGQRTWKVSSSPRVGVMNACRKGERRHVSGVAGSRLRAHHSCGGLLGRWDGRRRRGRCEQVQ